MKQIIEKFIFKSLPILALYSLAVCLARPAEGNYEMILIGDAGPLRYQDFDTFYNAGLGSNPLAELEMQESRGATAIRPPQAISEREKHLQESDNESYDVQREKRNQRTLHKGNTRPKHDGQQWEQFDYDAYVTKE